MVVHMHVQHTHTCLHIHIRTYTHTHIYIYTHTHTHIHIHIYTQALRGNVGLFFTNKSRLEVVEWFRNFSDQDFARAGFLSPQEVTLHEGPLEQFPHSTEPQLRQLGLPTTLKKGLYLAMCV